MAKTEHYYTQFEAECYYHVYNRTVDRQPMFRNEDNYEFFLHRFDRYISPVADTFCFALPVNHFHFGIQIKTWQELAAFRDSRGNARLETAHDIVSHQFQCLFLSYAKAFNKQHGRVGTLFQTPFKRCEVSDEMKIARLIYYVHSNWQKHGLIRDFRQTRWSSYQRFLWDRPTKLMRNFVFDLLGGRDNYIRFHEELHQDLDNWGLMED